MWKQGRNYTPPKDGALRSAEIPCRELMISAVLLQSSRGSYTSPALAKASYPFVDLPPKND